MKSRSRRSRIVARFALFAAVTALSTTLAAPAPAFAARLHAAAPSALLGHFSSPVGDPSRVRPQAPPAPHAARVLASVPQADGAGLAVAAIVATLLVGLGLAATAGSDGWLLEFARRCSRTRGQPRMGALAL